MTTVKYKRAWGVTFMVSSVVILVLYFILFSLTGELKLPQLVATVMIGIIGVLYYFNVYFEYDAHRVVLYSPFGFVTRRYLFDKNTQLVLSGKKLYQVKGGKRKRVWINASMCDPGDWKKFCDTFFGDDITRELHDID